MPMNPQHILEHIKSALPGAEVEIQDLAGDRDHFQVTVTSALFAGKSRIQQHKMVYDALQGAVGGKLHALSVKTIVPIS